MNNLDMKNIIVLKDLPSNIIDEAIVILKSNKIKRKDGNGTSEEFININVVEEAQQIIGEYIEKIEMTKKEKNNEKKFLIKYKKLQLITILLGAMMIVSFFINFIK